MVTHARSPISKPKLHYIFMLRSPGTGGSTSINQCLPALPPVPKLAPRLPFAFCEESNPAFTNQQAPSIALAHSGLEKARALQYLWSSRPSSMSILLHPPLNKAAKIFDIHPVEFCSL